MKRLLIAPLCAITLLTTIPTATQSESEIATNKPSYRYYSAEELAKEYVKQLRRLEELGYHEFFGKGPLINPFNCISEEWEWDKPVLASRALHSRLLTDGPTMPIGNGNIPFLIVIPNRYVPILWQATRLRVEGAGARPPDFGPNDVHDAETLPETPYIIFNIDLGTQYYNHSGGYAEGDWGETRRGLTLAEGLMLLIQYPEAMQCMRGIDENYTTRFRYTTPCFLGSHIGHAWPRDSRNQRPPIFIPHPRIGRPCAGTTERRELTPNYERFSFPSCDGGEPMR